MTPREIDAKIAEWCEPRPDINWDNLPDGWKDLHFSTRSKLGHWKAQIELGKIYAWEPKHYSTDLNAMAQAEDVVRERGIEEKYMWSLTFILIRDCGDKSSNLPQPGGWHFATATAAQRAEALCRVIGGLDSDKGD